MLGLYWNIMIRALMYIHEDLRLHKFKYQEHVLFVKEPGK